MVELLNCPFCGSTNIDPEEWSGGDLTGGPGCRDCGALGESVEAWNRRATPPSPSPAPTVEVDERAAFEAWWHERSLKSWQSGLLASEYGNPMPDGWGDGYKRHALESWMARVALSSKPPAREAAERQSIAYDPEFVIILKRVMAASERIDSYHGQRLIAYIDTWGGAAKGESNGG